MRRPGHRKADSLECLRKVQHQGHSHSILCFCSSIKSLHFHQYFLHCALSSSISTIRGVPINSILLLPLRHFWCSPGFPPTDQRRHKRNWPLTRDVLQNQREHRRAGLLRPFSTLFHLLQELHDFSARFFCQVQRNFWVESVTFHSCFCLVQSRCLVQVAFFQSRQRFLTFLQFLIPLWLVLHIHNDLTIPRLLFPPSESALLLSTSLAL